MSTKIIIFAAFVVLVASKTPDNEIKDSHASLKVNDHHLEIPHDYYAYPKYSFDYGVKDFKTGDYKTHKEDRDGDVVKGEYTVADPDGTIRTVTYTVTKHGGFQAVVKKSGDEHHEYESFHERETSGYKNENEGHVKNNVEENKTVDTMKKTIVSKSHELANTEYIHSYDNMMQKQIKEKNIGEEMKKSVKVYKNAEQLHQFKENSPFMELLMVKQQETSKSPMINKPTEYIPQYNFHSYDGYIKPKEKKVENKMIIPMKQHMMDMDIEKQLFYIPYYHGRE